MKVKVIQQRFSLVLLVSAMTHGVGSQLMMLMTSNKVNYVRCVTTIL